MSVQDNLFKHGYVYNSSIGRGGFGSCHLVTSMKYQTQFVCKMINNKNVNGNNQTTYQREVTALVHLDHPNIIHIYDRFVENGMMYIILEYCAGGTLKDTIEYYHGIKGQLLHEYTLQILEALKYVHDNGYAHNDIKPANIFITAHGQIKLADFGLTESGVIETSRFCGSFDYMSPESIQRIPHDPLKSDIWSLGITLYELASGNLPFGAQNGSELLYEIKCGYEKIPYISSTMSNVIKMCLMKDPSKRPTVDQLLTYVKSAQDFDVKPIHSISPAKRSSNPLFARQKRIVRPKIMLNSCLSKDIL